MWGENGVEGWTAMGRKRVVMVCYDTTRNSGSSEFPG